MIAAVLVATVAPDLGRSGGLLRLDLWSHAGIFTVFLLYGLGLPTGSIRDGVLQWRLHLVVQASTFLLFPLLWLALIRPLRGWLTDDLTLGFLFLCALPSTISSSVALTAVARGNVPAAIFDAALSSVLGVALTPLIVGLAWGSSSAPLPVASAIGDIALLLLLPLVLGQALRRPLGGWFDRHRHRVAGFDRAVILLLVLGAFSDSVTAGLWTDYGAETLLLTLLGASALLVAALLATRSLARALRFPREDEIVVVFCGSKKTLASGVPMASLLFADHPAIGILVLPILCYHQVQLMVGAALADRWARRG